MRLRIKVTQNDIDNGTPGKECECPVALAIKRAFEVDSVSVGDARIVIGCDIYRTPKIVREFVWAFDAPEPDWPPFTPFSFELPLEV